MTNHIAARAPHASITAHCLEFGTEDAQALYSLAFSFDALYFGAGLGPVFVEIATPGSPRAYAAHMPRTPEGVASKICVAPSVVAASPEFAADCLLHEMIHMWQNVTDNREPGYEGHGPKFAAKCNEIGALLGLPPVGVKGRDGLPDCAQWPLNVRPEGFYGASPRATKAVAAATKPRAKRVKKAAAKSARRIDWKKVAKALAKKYRGK